MYMYNNMHRPTSLIKQQCIKIKKNKIEKETKSQLTGFYNYKK